MMRFLMLSLLGALLVCGAAYAADTDNDADADASVAVETSAPVTADSDVDVTADTGAEPRRSLRDEYRQWSRTTAKTTRRPSRTSSGKRLDSVNDIDSVGRDVEDFANEDVANTDRDRYDDGLYRRSADRDDYARTTSREVDRYADYPNYDNDAVDADRIGDRMYDDYDRGGDRYWSRSYGDTRYYDSRDTGCPCKSCSKCGRSYGGGGCGKCGTSKCGGKCGVSKCGSCMSHKPAITYTPCDKCGSRCSSCHKPAASCNKCGKCGGKCGGSSKCSSGKCGSRKCSKC